MASGEAGRLFVVATPLGNLEDLTPRARRTLQEVDVIAAEDTRVSARLLDRGEPHGRLLSYREHNERSLAPRLVERLLAGENVALVCDAGTPGISDPGYRLVRAAAEAGITVVPVVGPSAAVALLSVAGLPTDRFSFEGFLAAKPSARRKQLTGLKGCGRTVVFYEAPHRIVAMLDDVADVLGDPHAAVGRELTKLYEEVLRGSASELARRLETQGPRGEFVVALDVAEESARLEGDELGDEVARLLEQGLGVREVAATLKEYGASRREVYAAARERKPESKESR